MGYQMNTKQVGNSRIKSNEKENNFFHFSLKKIVLLVFFYRNFSEVALLLNIDVKIYIAMRKVTS